MVYYFTAAFPLGAPQRKVAFTVPTGNFGDVFAGYVAARMGLPIERLLGAYPRADGLLLHCRVSAWRAAAQGCLYGANREFRRCLRRLRGGPDGIADRAPLGRVSSRRWFITSLPRFRLARRSARLPLRCQPGISAMSSPATWRPGWD